MTKPVPREPDAQMFIAGTKALAAAEGSFARLVWEAMWDAAPAALESPTQDQRDAECICRGNWRAIVKECQPLLDRQYRSPDGNEWIFFGVVLASDDYYYGMCRNGEMRLLSCVGSIEGHGYAMKEAP